ncbi:MAG: hypothetical protein ISQ54_01905 [Candidatus Poseidonia sp.]|nr:hypothetical protein [Poseidonia sp.]
MAAPRRKPQRPKPVSAAPVSAAPAGSAYSGSILQNGEPPATPVTTVRPNATMNSDDLLLMKLSQGIMMGIGFLAIWGGIFSVAFDEDATNENFLVLFIGGVASFAVSIGIIELQSKKNQYRLQDIQNYFLGIAFFFSTVGVLWGTRYLMGIATGTFEVDWFGNPADYNGGIEWSPNANGIYAQLAGTLLLTYGHFRLLKRYSGDTSFGWGVATYAPMAILIAGVGPWIRWSDSLVSYELGISIVVLSMVSMEMALRSNKALNFGIVAFASGLTPIIYEVLNENAPATGEGGALSLMVFIIALQGYYAARQDLRKEVMERASIFLVGQVVVALLLMRDADFNLILGPLRTGEFPVLDAYISLPVALWCTVLLAYFPAVLQQRVPWMPIGLAVALFVLPTETSTVPWVLAMVMIPYMVFISKIAREWVVNATLLAFSASYLLTDLIASEIDMSAKMAFGGTYLHIILPIFIVAVSEFGRRLERINPSISLGMLGCVILSRAILDPEWFMPWLLIGYMMFLNFNIIHSQRDDQLQHRKDTTLALAFTSITVFILTLFDVFEMPPYDVFGGLSPDGFKPQYIVMSLAMYSMAHIGREVEFDAGSILAWMGQGPTSAPTYDEASQSWIVDSGDSIETMEDFASAGWTPLFRFSLLTSLTMFAFSISEMSLDSFVQTPYWVLLMIIPVGILVWEIINLDEISSATRAGGVALLVFLAAPISLQMQSLAFNSQDPDVIVSAVLLDLILVSAPLAINALIAKRGIDKSGLNFGADGLAYVLLMILASLDSSGGILLIPLVSLIAFRSIQHRHYGVTLLTPIVFLWLSDQWMVGSGVTNSILDALPLDFQTYLLDQHLGPFTALAGIFVATHMTMNILVMQRDENKEPAYHELLAFLWLGLALLSALPDGYWLPTIFSFVTMSYLWYNNNSTYLPYMLGVLFISLFIGFNYSETFSTTSEIDAWSWSGLITGFTGSMFNLLHVYGQLFRTEPDDDDERKIQQSTSTLSLQIGVLGYLVGYEVFFGIGPVIGLAILAYSVYKGGQASNLLILPALVTFASINVMIQSDIGTVDERTTLAGAILAIHGIMFTLLSNKDDLIYDWENIEWESDREFFAYMDRLGLVGTAYTLIGVFMCLVPVDLTSIAYLITTMYLVFIGIQGFSEELDARWRRGIGGYGSILTSFLFTTTLENDLFNAVGIVMMGLLALGFGFLFMQRMNENDGIYVEEAHDEPPLMSEKTAGGEAPPEEEMDEPEPVLATTAKVVEEPVEEVEDKALRQTRDEDRSIEETSADEDEFDWAEEEAEVSEEPKKESEPELRQEPEAPSHSGLLDTGEGFAVRLPSDAVTNIMRSIEQTPHEGYVPVVAFGPSGQIMLNFEPNGN